MLDRPVTSNREVSEDERVEMFRQQFFQSSLPDLPEIPGWHMCWLTTTNPRDAIQQRIRLGYEPVKPEEVPGWEYATLKGGDWNGFIGVNEMLAFKLPMSLYEKYMMEAHHDAPAREEEKLSDTASFMEQQAKASGGRMDMGDGTKEIGERREGQFDLA
tara:strand:- start:6591 stop:7067 length:477 start_codon:yes stop_codon:yes gene_type:complete